MNRTSTAFAVLAAAGLAGTTGGSVLGTLIAPAAAQQQDQTEQRSQAQQQSETEQRRESERGRQQQSESQIARAGGDAAGMPTSSITVERSQEHGEYVADGEGRALYLLEGESGGESQCYDRCAEQWPPAIAMQGEEPRAEGEQIDESLLGTFERRDGGSQITYGDYPLYYYYQDQGPGDTSGHDVHDEWGGWYLVTPEGEQLESEESGN